MTWSRLTLWEKFGRTVESLFLPLDGTLVATFPMFRPTTRPTLDGSFLSSGLECETTKERIKEHLRS